MNEIVVHISLSSTSFFFFGRLFVSRVDIHVLNQVQYGVKAAGLGYIDGWDYIFNSRAYVGQWFGFVMNEVIAYVW